MVAFYIIIAILFGIASILSVKQSGQQFYTGSKFAILAKGVLLFLIVGGLWPLFLLLIDIVLFFDFILKKNDDSFDNMIDDLLKNEAPIDMQTDIKPLDNKTMSIYVDAKQDTADNSTNILNLKY